jgi:solute carrier family 6 amino acid transporter-like protein 5/7/9/14
MSSGIHEMGHLNWHLVLCLFGAWLIVGLCIIKGVKSVGKVR